MASRISQMRNGQTQPWPQQQSQPQPQTLDASIAYARNMMHMVQNSNNPQAMLAQLLQNNPNTGMLANMLKSNGDLESLARQMAQMKGYDINQIINGLNTNT